MKLWESLRPGDEVEIVAPSSACTKSEFLGAVRFLKSWGLRPQYPEDLLSPIPFCSHTDEKRAYFLKKAIHNKKIKAVWCLRGGYGSLRLLPKVFKIKPPIRPKLFIGYSDATNLHYLLNQFWGWPTIHGPLLSRLGQGQAPSKELKELYNMIFGIHQLFEHKSLVPMNVAAQKKREVRGRLIGGNLMTLQALMGTPWQTSSLGKILFFEEVNERGYRVDRAFEQMVQSGFFKGAKAVIFGHFLGGKEPNGRFMWKAALERLAKRLSIPVLKGLQVGHGFYQRPLPLNTPCRLKLGSDPLLQVHSGGTLNKEEGAWFID